MTRRILTSAFALLILCDVGQCASQSLDELQQRFKKRYPQLLSYKKAGKVGEKPDGRPAFDIRHGLCDRAF